MSRADEMAAKAARMQQQSAPSGPERAAVPRARAKLVRRTVDLAPTHHGQLQAWCAETAVELGVARVTGQDVIRALVVRLLTDETMARRIRADLAQHFKES